MVFTLFMLSTVVFMSVFYLGSTILKEILKDRKKNLSSRISATGKKLSYMAIFNSAGKVDQAIKDRIKSTSKAMEDIGDLVPLLNRRERRELSKIESTFREIEHTCVTFKVKVSEDVLNALDAGRMIIEGMIEIAKSRADKTLRKTFDNNFIAQALKSIDTPEMQTISLHSPLARLAPALSAELRGYVTETLHAPQGFTDIAAKLDALKGMQDQLDPNTLRHLRSVCWSFLGAMKELRQHNGKVTIDTLPDLEKLERFFEIATSKTRAQISQSFETSMNALTRQTEINGLS